MKQIILICLAFAAAGAEGKFVILYKTKSFCPASQSSYVQKIIYERHYISPTDDVPMLSWDGDTLMVAYAFPPMFFVYSCSNSSILVLAFIDSNVM